MQKFLWLFIAIFSCLAILSALFPRLMEDVKQELWNGGWAIIAALVILYLLFQKNNKANKEKQQQHISYSSTAFEKTSNSNSSRDFFGRFWDWFWDGFWSLLGWFPVLYWALIVVSFMYVIGKLVKKFIEW